MPEPSAFSIKEDESIEQLLNDFGFDEILSNDSDIEEVIETAGEDANENNEETI